VRVRGADSVCEGLSHPNLTVRRTGDFVRPRKWIQLSGLGQSHDLGVHNPTISVLERSLLERVFYCEVKPGEFKPALGSSPLEWSEMDAFARLLDKFNGRYWKPQTATEVVDYYHGAKRQVYEVARLDLVREPTLQKRDCRSVVFAKFEKANLSKAPRAIQPRDPRYNVLVGKYIKQIEHRIYRSIAKAFNVENGGEGSTVIKGFNVEQTAAILHAKWESFANPICIGLDAKKFDMHVSTPALRFEHAVYLKMFRNDPKLERLLKHQIHNNGRGYCADGDLKFKIEGVRFSGDMNTALGNCLIMCALVWTWAKRVGVKIKLANNGDDCVVFLEKGDEQDFVGGLEEWFASKGFRMDVEATVTDFEAVEFCQSHPVWNGTNFVMCRSVPNVLIKDSMCLVPANTPREIEQWCAAIGMCGGSLSKGVPVMQSFYRCLRRCGQGRKPSKGLMQSIYKNSGQFERMKSLSYDVREIGARERYSFWIATGITPCLQLELEKYYDGYNLTTTVSKEVSAVQIKDTTYIEFPQDKYLA